MKIYKTTLKHPAFKKGIKVILCAETKPTNASYNHNSHWVEVCKFQLNAWLKAKYIKRIKSKKIKEFTCDNMRKILQSRDHWL